MEEACIRGVLLEDSAKTQVAAASMGGFTWATDADALLKRKRIYRPDAMINLWEYYLRCFARTKRAMSRRRSRVQAFNSSTSSDRT